MPEFSLYDVDPGVRSLVCLLRREGFDTTDSGDGRTKPPSQRVHDVSHVFMRARTPADAVTESRRLVNILSYHTIDFADPTIHVEMSWSPLDDVAIIRLLGVTSSHLPSHLIRELTK